MAKQSKRRKFSNNQPVVFRFGERKLFGKVIFARPIGKKFTYDVFCEDGKVYSELHVDTSMNQCIDTYLTRLFYKKYKIDENFIPEVEKDLLPVATSTSLIEESDATEDVSVDDDKEEILYEDDEFDPNY